MVYSLRTLSLTTSLNADVVRRLFDIGRHRARDRQRHSNLYPLISAEWYAERYPDVLASGISPISHFIEHGMAEGRDPHPLFDGKWYRRRYSDVPAEPPAIQHFAEFGMAEGRDPHPLFDGEWYRRRYPDVPPDKPAVQHFLEYGMAEGRDPHPLFESAWYLRQYPDVDAAGLPPFVHFLTGGLEEGRDPHPLFDGRFYRARYGGEAETPPIIDFIDHGLAAGRDPSPLFDSDWYRERYPDVMAAGMPPFEHFLRIGFAEGRDPHRLFSSAWYGERYPDTVADGSPAFAHFLNHGRFELRDPHPLFDSAWYAGRYADLLGDTPPFEHYLQNGHLRPNRAFDPTYVAWQLSNVPQRSGRRSETLHNPVLRPGKSLLDAYVASWRADGVRPCRFFDPVFYLETYPGVEHGRAEPLWHFLNYGLREGLRPCRELDLSFYVAQTGTGETEEGFWRILDQGLDPVIRPVATYIPALDKARLDALHSGLANRLPKLLIIGHSWGGGTSKHMAELAEHFVGKINIVLLLPRLDKMISLGRPGSKDGPLLFEGDRLFDQVLDVIRELGFDRVHVHHALGLEERLEDLLNALALPFDVTLHDTYFLTPNPFFDHARQARSRPGLDAVMGEALRRPINGKPTEGVSLAQWRDRFRPVLIGAERVIAPSRFMADLFRSFHPELAPIVAPSIEVVREGLPLDRPTLTKDEPLIVAVLGEISPHKGSNVILRCAIRAGVRNLPIRFVAIGTGPDEDALRKAGVTVHGAYDDGALPALIKRYGAHAVWYPSRAPESYSYTLSVGLQTGLAIAASDVGCFPERLAGVPQARVLPVETDPEAWLDDFVALRDCIATSRLERRAVTPVPSEFYENEYLSPLTEPSRRVPVSA